MKKLLVKNIDVVIGVVVLGLIVCMIVWASTPY